MATSNKSIWQTCLVNTWYLVVTTHSSPKMFFRLMIFLLYICIWLILEESLYTEMINKLVSWEEINIGEIWWMDSLGFSTVFLAT